MKSMKFSRQALARVCVSVWIAFSAATAWAQYNPPAQFPYVTDETTNALAKRVLPAGATLLYAAQQLPFGNYASGTALAFSMPATQTSSKGYAIWYLFSSSDKKQLRLVALRDPQELDEFFDFRVRAIFATGPEGAKDMVVLDTQSRHAAAGGRSEDVGRVFRRAGGSSIEIEKASEKLSGVKDERSAIKALSALYTSIPTPARGSLADYFLDIPVQYVDLTRTERWAHLKPGSRTLKINDNRNGFLSIAGDGGFPGYQMVLFKSQTGSPLIALQRIYPVGQETFFLKREQQGWHEVADLVPGYEARLSYQLPRTGTTLAVKSEEGTRKLYHLLWNRERFVKGD
jgi:hypothetical protein